MPQYRGPSSWKEAWNASPGPKGAKESFLLFLKGFSMGAADIIPGVSGGTVALITGIYYNLLLAIKSFGLPVIRSSLGFRFKEALGLLHARFLFFLLLGIGFAIIGISRIMHYLLNEHPIPTWALFFGLILASALVLGKKIQNWIGGGGIGFVGGSVAGFFLVGMIPVDTPTDWWFVLISGMIAICAMILPGISGAFILLILGKYEFVTGALKNPFLFENLKIILVFCVGCLIGITSFSRILSFLLARFESLTLAFLTGLMFGSLRKIWPWKEVLATKIVRGKVLVLDERNQLPPVVDAEFFLALALAVLGILIVLFLDKVATRDHGHG